MADINGASAGSEAGSRHKTWRQLGRLGGTNLRERKERLRVVSISCWNFDFLVGSVVVSISFIGMNCI